MEAPRAKKVPHIFKEHGVEREDPYHWLRERDRPDVIAHLEAENKYTAERLKPVAKLEEELFQEIKARIKKTDISYPYRDRGDYFYTRVEEGSEYEIYCRKKKTLEAPEEILLDCNERAKGKDYYSCGLMNVSPDGKTLAFAEDVVGRRIYSLRFKDLDSGKVLDLEIPGTTGNLVWSEQKSIFFL